MIDQWRADVEDMDGVNADKLLEAMEIEFENIMDEEKSEVIWEMLSDDSGCASNMSEYEIDRVEKFV